MKPGLVFPAGFRPEKPSPASGRISTIARIPSYFGSYTRPFPDTGGSARVASIGRAGGPSRIVSPEVTHRHGLTQVCAVMGNSKPGLVFDPGKTARKNQARLGLPPFGR